MRIWKKSVYLDSEAVDALKKLVKEWYYYNWIRLNSMSQVVLALIKEREKYIKK